MSLEERFVTEIAAALAAIEREEATAAERVDMLVEIAMGLQQKPKAPDQLLGAIALDRKALELCPEDQPLLRARTTARMATELQAVPTDDPCFLDEALSSLQVARPALESLGLPEEVAEADMNIGAGQSHFSAKGDNRWGPPLSDTLCWPYWVSVTGSTAVISDTGNNRVLLCDFAPDFPIDIPTDLTMEIDE